MSRVFNMVGGGGASLNFKVVGGTTQPTNPSENMIWVNTSTAISSWVFSSTEPVATEDGLVWLATGNSAAVPINILRDNTLMVYPTGVQQFVSGAWVTKEAMTFQNNEWKSWCTYLYNNGDICSNVTGGWVNGGIATPTGAGGWNTRTFETDVEFGATAITLSVLHTSGRILTTDSQIDLTKYKKLVMVVDQFSGPTTGRYLAVRTAKTANWTSSTGNTVPPSSAKSVAFTDVGTIELDIASLSGSYYIAVSSINNSGLQTTVISSIYLE